MNKFKIVKKSISVLLSIYLLLYQFLIFVPQHVSKPLLAASHTIDTQTQWQGGRYDYNKIDTESSAGSIKLQTDKGTWDGQESPSYLDHYVGAGGATSNTKILKIGKFVYVFRNRAIGQFMRYDIETQEWKEMAYLPTQAYEVIDATSDGISTIYAFATRTNRKHFLKYDIPTNTWEYLSNVPLGLGIGATLEYVSGSTNYVYAMQGGGTGFWRFNTNPAVYSWSSQLTTTATCNNYCDLHYDGSQYLYLASNNYNPDRFLRIDTTLTSPTWSTVANFEADTSVNYGSDLVSVGADFYMMRTGTAHPGTQTLYKYTGGSWTIAADVPFFTAYGSMTYDATNNRIIVLGGIGEMAFYYPDSNTWSNQSKGPPSNAYQTGTTLAADGSNNIYMCRGQSQNTCYIYSTSGNSWTALPTTNAPTIGSGGSLSFTNGYLYTYRGSASSQIGRYTPGSPGSWLVGNLSPVNPVTLAEGASVVASDSASMFVAVGGAGVNFRKYTISTNTYSTLTNFPEAVYRGSGLIAGSDGGLQYIYALLGGNRGKFYRYHETTNGWYELASLPVGSYYGAGLAYDSVNGYIYATVGGENQVWSKRLYRYSIASNTWTRIADAPAMIRNGGGIVYTNNALYVYQGYGGSMWKYTPPTTTYKTTGTWYSPVYDNTHVSAWGSFSTSDSGSGITYYTRTSTNSTMWDDWVQVSGSTIGSEKYRYIQVKAVLTGDGNSTPTVSSITINYTGDATAPDMTNFSVTGYVEKGSSTPLVSGNTYTYTNPYFSWNGASETETSLTGYYVYWGTEDLDPVTQGNFQTTSNYVVNAGLVNGQTYKLRIAAKNANGITSTPTTYFTYTYNGISPATTTIVADTQDQWDATGSAKVNVSTSGTTWWNQNYNYRKKLTITATSNLQPGTIIKTDIDTDVLETEARILPNRKDWRIVYWDGSRWKDLNRQYNSATETYFALQKGIVSGNFDDNYYAYYGNATETNTPSESLDSVYAGAKWAPSGMKFDGGNDYIQIPTVINNLSTMTIEGWFKYDDPATNRWFYGNNSTTQTAVGIIASSHYATYSIRVGSTTYANNGTTWLESGKWYHFALTYDGATGTEQGFINGRLDFTRTGLSGNVSVTQAQYLGRSNTQYYIGALDEIRISNTVRYTQDFTPPLDVFTQDANTLSLYHFDDSTGQTLTDSSVNNNHGTLGSAVGVDINDPSWTYFGTATVGTEESFPETPDDTTLTLESMSEGSWAGYQLPSRPFGAQAGYGASIIINNEMYSIRGANTVSFFKLNIVTGVWTQLADLPAAAYYGAAMVYDGSGAIYASRGNANSGFYKYTIATNTWTSTIDQPVYTFSYGAVMTKVGSKIYIFPGGNVTTFLSFDPNYESTGDSIDAWSTLQSAPYNAYSGSGLASDDAGSLWYVSGNGSGFAKYDIDDDTWDTTITAPATIPYTIMYSSHNAFYYNGYIYTFTTYDHQGNNETKNRIWRYKISTDTWENIQTVGDFWMYTGQVAFDGSRYVYLSNGYQGSNSGNNAIVRYDLVTNTYFPDTPILPMSKLFSGDNEFVLNQSFNYSSIAYDSSDSLYVLHGANSSTPVNNWMHKYSFNNKTWSMQPNPPCYTAGGMTYAQNKLYLVCSGNTKKFYSFDPATSEWTNLPDVLGNINAPGSQIITHDGNQTLYAIGGGQVLYKYTIDGTWETESSSVPGSISTGRGASITSDQSDYLYVFRGNGTSDFYRYKYTDTKGWTTLTSVPENLSQGSTSVLYNGKIYVSTGYMNSQVYIYDIASNVWQRAPNTLSPLYAGSAMTKGPGDSIYMLQGWYFLTMWKYNIPSSSTSYKHSGNYVSRPVDLTSPYKIAGLTATVASPSATTIAFETRTSTDSAHWNDWILASDLKQNPSNQFTYHINSTMARYIQVKVSMTSDESYQSPQVDDIKVVYYGDSSPPTNPNVLSAYQTSTKAALLSDNTWYNKESPYFEWSGAGDGTGSGISGYYVYFGSNENASASESGSFQTNANYTASLETDGSGDGEYYLIIQSVDGAGNISESNWTSFHYRYDKTPPIALDENYLVVSPDGSSNINNYTFYWDQTESSDVPSNATSSGLLGYYYKTGTASGTFAQEQLTTETTIGSVTAYREGDNTFYLRAADIAGNSTATITKTYKYNSTAPSAPRNLAVDTSRAGSNYFSFSWDEPATYRGTIEEYRYSVNGFPLTDANISTTSARIVNNIRGTQDGNNTFYVVAVDDAGNVSYDNYASKEFSVSVTAPGIPLNPETFDNSIRATQTYRVGLTWDAPADKGSSFDRYDIYASTEDVECSTDMSSYVLTGSTAGTSYVATSIGEDELESITYYFCIKACATTNQCSSPSTTVSMLPTGRWLNAPSMTSTASATVKTRSAIISWTTDRTSSSFVKYGKTSGTYGDEVGSSNQTVAHQVSLKDLEPGTTYYAQCLWTDEDGNTGSSSEFTFSTNPAPVISNVEIEDISISSAFITATVNNASTGKLQYGISTSYGSEVDLGVSQAGGTYTHKLEDLLSDNEYHVRVVAEDEEGNITYGEDHVFQTLPEPKILNVVIQQVVDMPTATIRLVWNANTEISQIVTYYPTTNPEQAKDKILLTRKITHELILTDLKNETDYTILIKGRDLAGNEASADPKQVTTSSDLRSPEIIDLNVESTIIGTGDNARAQIIVCWDTDEPATTQVEYGEGTGSVYSSTTQEDTNLTTNHCVTVPGLQGSKIYHLRASSKDKSGNIGSSFDTVIVTPSVTKDALNLVIDKLSVIFGFLRE